MKLAAMGRLLLQLSLWSCEWLGVAGAVLVANRLFMPSNYDGLTSSVIVDVFGFSLPANGEVAGQAREIFGAAIFKEQTRYSLSMRDGIVVVLSEDERLTLTVIDCDRGVMQSRFIPIGGKV